MAAGECSLSPVSAQTQYGQGGDTLVFSFSLSDNGGCSEESGAVKIISDSTESASLNQTTWNGSVGKTSTVSVKLGGNIGGEVVFVVQCKNCAAPNSLTFTGIVVGDYLFTAKPLSSINSTVPADTVLPLNVSLTKTGTPVPDVEVIWSQFSGPSIASVTPITGDKTDSNGENTIEFKASVPGIYVLRAIICDPAGGNRCSQLIVNFTIDVGGTPGGLQFNRISPPSPITAAPGDKISLTAEYLFKNSGYIGQKVNWDITPVSGASLQTSSTIVTDSSGKVSNQVVVDTPGSYTVTAKADCEGTEPGCPQPDIVWVINVGSSKLEIIGGDNQSGPINTLSGGLDVQATTGGSPTVGLNLIWSVLAGDATINSTTGLTDSSGKASADVLYGNTASNIVVQAARGDDPSIRVRFNLASGIPQLDNLTGNVNMVAGQSVALSGFANISGVAQGFGRINWTNNNAGTSSITSTSTPVDSGGRASVNFTPNQGGSFSVTACYSAIGSATCVGGDPVTTFTINAVALKKTSGDGQTLTVGTPSAPLSIKFEIGTPPNPQNIQWSVTGPATLSSFATTTTAAGDTSITVTPTGTGVITVRAGWISVLPGVGNQQVNFSLSAAAPALTPVSANPIVAVVGTPFNAVVQLLDGLGAPMVGANIKFTSNTGVNSTPTTIATNAGGQADSGAIFTAQVAALLNNVVKAEYDPTPLSPSSGDEAEFKFSVNASAAITRTITVAPASIEVYSGSSSYPIVFTTLDNGVPTGGITVNFNSAGDATVAPASCVTNASGTCSVNVDPSGVAFPGSSTVTGTRADDASAFAIHTVSVAQPSIVSIAGNGANGDAGTLVTLSAEVHNGFVGNAAIVGGTVSWAIIADTAGSSLSTTSSNTDGSGIASTSLTLGTLSGTVIVRATYDYGSGTVTTDFSVSINTVRTLLLHDGDGQTTPAGLAFPVNVVVEALNDGVSAPDGTQIQYSIDASSTATGTLLSCCGTTSGGFSGVGVTAGTTQGNLVIRAQRVDNPAAFILFNLTVAPPILQSIAVTPATPTIAHNGAQTFVATGTYSDASTADISASVVWTSSNTSLATMTGATANGAGSFTGGATTITATLGAVSGTATLNVTAAPVVLVSIAVTPATSTIASNGTQTFVATGTYSDASTADISASVIWTSSNTSLATMTGATANGAGSFTGGATTITATLGAISGTATLNVTAASVVLVSIAVTPATPTIAFNGSQTFVATGTYNDASTADISASVIWTSSNTSLATMTGATANGAGSFTGGTTTITATLGAINGTASLNVTAAPVVLVSIAVTPATPTIAFNGSQTFVATGTYNDASTADISASVVWTSSNTTLATMTGATANGAGSFTGGATTITATQGAITGTATLNVTAAPVVLVSIAVTPGTSTIASNGAQSFVATGTYNDASTADISASVVWTSSNTSLATMTGATANGAGSFTGGATTITATLGAISGTATLNVTAASVVLVSIAVTPATSTIAFNGSQTFVATGTYNDASTADISASVVWTSSNTSLATMTGATATGAGSFTGGTTTITATQGAVSGAATLNVTAAPVVLVSIAVTPATPTIAFNGSQTFVATGTYNDASTADISASVVWTSSNTSLATMTGATANGAGSFTGGATTITATQGAITGTATLNVTAQPAVKTISISAGDGQSIIAGTAFSTMSVSAQDNGIPVSGLNISWTVSGTGSATPAITSSATDTSGIATITMTSVNPGTITVTAARSDDLTKFVNFNHVINPVPASTLSKQSGDAQQGVLGSLINNPLIVRLLDGFGAPISGQTITWSVLSGPATLSATSSTSDVNGDAQILLTFGNSAGTATIRASALAGSLTQDFTASAVNVTLGSASGNGQSGPVSTTLPIPLTVQITPPAGVTSLGPKYGSTKALSGVPITFAITTGSGASLSVTNVLTNAGGSASTTLTLGPTAGLYVVTASTPGGSTASFSATATTLAAGSISKLSGDSQSLTPGNASVLMRVRLLDAVNNPIAGAVIQWTAVNGTLTAATSTTDAAGEATNIVAANSSGAVSVSASYTDPATSLVTGPVTFNHNAGIGNLSGLSGEQQEIANTIDTLCPALAAIASPTPSQTALLNDCTAIIDSAAIDPAATANALDQLLPDAALAQATASMLAAQSQFQNLKARIAALRSGTQGTSFEGLAFTNSSGTISLGALGNALSGDDGASKEVGTDFQRWGFFAAGTIGRGEAEAGNINPAFDYDINGLTAGLDYRYSDKFIFGGAVGITRQGTDLAGSEGSLDTTGWSVSAYSTFYKENSWYADSVLTYGRNNYDLERRIRYTLPIPGGGFTTIDQTGRSSSSGDLLEAAFTFGHDFQKGGLSIGPYARLLYTKLGFDESVEQLESGPGSGLGIVIETRDLTSIASQVGAKFTYSYSADWGVIIPHLQVEWEHEFKDDPAQITARFLNDPTATPMVITGDPQDTDYFRIGIGLSMILNKGRSGFIYYEQMLGRDGYNQYNLGLGLRVEF
jgi:hypothetical protein